MEPFIGQIAMFGGNFAPRGWAYCDGQLLPIAAYTALFSLYGTTYGGDGRTTFGLPNLQTRFPIHTGFGPGLSPYRLGQIGGGATETLKTQELAQHNHPWMATGEDASVDDPSGQYVAVLRDASFAGAPSGGAMSTKSTLDNVGGQPHNNVHSYGVVNYIVALVGTYPSRG